MSEDFVLSVVMVTMVTVNLMLLYMSRQAIPGKQNPQPSDVVTSIDIYEHT